MPIKIFIDLTSSCRHLTGIEIYSLQLVRSIIKIDSPFEYHILFRKFIYEVFKETINPNVFLYISPFTSQILTEQVYIPFFINKNKFDFCFFPCFPPGILVQKEFSLMVFDATMWKYKQYLSLKNKLYFKPLWEIAIKKAKLLFTISPSSEQDIISTFTFLKTNIYNLNAAISEGFIKVDRADSNRTLQRLNIYNKYFLCVGSLEPRKNIPFIIKSVAPILVEKDLFLVLVGRKAWGTNEIDRAIDTGKITDRIIKTDYVSEYDLRCLYSNAEVFIYTSFYEGFGFPILEAFACECPVITSNLSSMPFVAGDAALLINPLDVNSLRDAINKILNSNKLKTDLIQKGKAQLQNFSWEISANKYLIALNNYFANKNLFIKQD